MDLEKKDTLANRLLAVASHLTMERWKEELLGLERNLVERHRDRMVLSTSRSPMRKEGIIHYPDLVGWKPLWEELKEVNKIMPLFVDVVRSARASMKEITKNDRLRRVKDRATPELWEKFEAHARELGVDLIGYTRVERDLIFQGKGIFFENIIVLGMELDEEAVKSSPRFDASLETIRVYRDLGEVSMKLTRWLQRQGYRAQCLHPFGGPLVMPVTAARAGLGALGKHGLLVTPQFGPRQRLAGIATAAGPLPGPKKNPLPQLPEFCASCQRCVRTCPGKAFYDEPVATGEGDTLSHIDLEKCYKWFARYKNCSICLKSCSNALKQAGMLDRSYRYEPA